MIAIEIALNKYHNVWEFWIELRAKLRHSFVVFQSGIIRYIQFTNPFVIILSWYLESTQLIIKYHSRENHKWKLCSIELEKLWTSRSSCVCVLWKIMNKKHIIFNRLKCHWNVSCCHVLHVINSMLQTSNQKFINVKLMLNIRWI